MVLERLSSYFPFINFCSKDKKKSIMIIFSCFPLQDLFELVMNAVVFHCTLFFMKTAVLTCL